MCPCVSWIRRDQGQGSVRGQGRERVRLSSKPLKAILEEDWKEKSWREEPEPDLGAGQGVAQAPPRGTGLGREVAGRMRRRGSVGPDCLHGGGGREASGGH